jgi:hypothetical protein
METEKLEEQVLEAVPANVVEAVRQRLAEIKTLFMNRIISRTVDLPGGVVKVTGETTRRKNYAEFEDRIKSLCYKITVL